MTRVLAFMSTRKLFFADIIALWNQSATYNWRLEECLPAGTRLLLTVYDWAFLAETDVAGLTALVLFAVEHLVAGKLAGVVFDDGGISEPAADLVADVLSAASLLLTDKLTPEWLLVLAPAFYLAALQAANTSLL